MKALLRPLQPLWQPTLVRRVVVALALAFALVGSVLLGLDYLEFKRTMAQAPGVKALGDAIAGTLARVPDARDAALVVSTRADELNTLRREDGRLPGDVLFELRGTDGRVAFASPALQGWQAPAGSPAIAVLDIGGRAHWTARVERGPWRLFIAEPHVPDVRVLGLIGRELLFSLLLAFPLVLLPLWIAVQRGLRPLRELARRVAARDAADLSPLDITPKHAELKPLVASFDGLLAQLRAHVQRERAFVQDAAHELRTPMAAIAAQAHVLSHTPDEGDRREAGAALDHALERASHLSRQLLDLAALDDAHPRAPQEVDLAVLTQQALATAAPQALALGLDLSLDAPDRLPCRVDRVAFESILHNLVDNALRYVPADGRIAVALRRAGDRVWLTVADDGPGIPHDQRDRAFERFWRGDTEADVPGSGLGLAIVRQAAGRLGGQVHVEDGIDGRGVAFVLGMPVFGKA
jgi:two-component system, OmpR family, sensor histidine kinase QseC